MSGSKLLRLCSLFLCLLLCLVNFSVVANAAEDTENLVDSTLTNWDLIYEPSTLKCSVTRFSNFPSNFYTIYFRSYPDNIPVGSYACLNKLTNMTFGEVYNFDFSLYFDDLNIDCFDYYTLSVGFAYLDNEGDIVFIDDNSFITISNETHSFSNGTYDFNLSFKNNSLTDVYLCFYLVCHQSYSNNNSTYSYVPIFGNVSLTRQPSETENKLDGILGWLEDIKNSIVGLPETIKTNFQTFFSDLENKVNDFKNTVSEKFTNLSTEFSSYITGLGDRVSGFFIDLKENISSYFTDLWNKFSAFFEKFKPRINVDFGFKHGYFNDSTNEFIYSDSSRYYLSDVIVIPKGCELHLSAQVFGGGRFRIIDCTESGLFPNGGTVTTYNSDFETDFIGYDCIRIEYYGSLYDGYIDKGWFTYFTYTLRHKIDIKIEEIKTSIHDFFVPPEGFFEEWKDKFDLMLSDNLGFIYQAPNFVIEIVEVIQEILQSDQEVNLVFPEVEFDIAGYHVELFKDTKVDFSFLEAGIWLTLYSMYKVMLYVIFALVLIKYGMSTWERTMSN